MDCLWIIHLKRKGPKGPVADAIFIVYENDQSDIIVGQGLGTKLYFKPNRKEKP